MKKLLPFGILFLISSFCFADLQPTIEIQDKASDILSWGFFGVRWGDKMPRGYLTYKTIDGQGIEIYSVNRSVRFHGIDIQEVLMGFYKEKFCSGSLRFAARKNYEKIKEILKSTEGGAFVETPAQQGKVLACYWTPASSQPYHGSVTLMYNEAIAQGDLMFINLNQNFGKK